MSKGKRKVHNGKRRGPAPKKAPAKDRATEELRADLSKLLDPPKSPASLLAANQPNPPRVKK